MNEEHLTKGLELHEEISRFHDQMRKYKVPAKDIAELYGFGLGKLDGKRAVIMPGYAVTDGEDAEYYSLAKSPTMAAAMYRMFSLGLRSGPVVVFKVAIAGHRIGPVEGSVIPGL